MFDIQFFRNFMISVGSGEREREGFLFEGDMDVFVQKIISKIKFIFFSFFFVFNLFLLYKYYVRYNYFLIKSNFFI